VHNFGTCVWRTDAQWRLPEKRTCFDAGKIRFGHCAAVLQTQVPKLCTDLDLSFLYILILGSYSKFARKNNFLALGVCFTQPCSSAGHRFAASRSCLQNHRRIVSFPQQKFRWNALLTGFHRESAFAREIPNPTLMSHVTHVNESRHTCQWASHMCMSDVAHADETFAREWDWIMPSMWMCQVTHVNAIYYTRAAQEWYNRTVAEHACSKM